MAINDLKYDAQEEVLQDIMTKLISLEPGYYPVTNLLAAIIDQLDEMDGDDVFGTEGWRHLFGYEA